MSSLEDQLSAGRMLRRPPQDQKSKIDELAATPPPAPPRSHVDRLTIEPRPDISPPIMKPLAPEVEAELRKVRREVRQGSKKKTTFGLTADALKAKRFLAHWSIDNETPMDDVVSALLVAFAGSEDLRTAIAAQLNADT